MKRREFINKAALGTTGIALVSTAGIFTSCSRKRPDDKFILALIGAGKRGLEIASGIYQADNNIAFKYVCDVNDQKAERAVRIINSESGSSASSVRNMKDIFDDREVDAVLIATPDHWHALATIRACKAGKDVYVEANPCLTLWEGRKMVQAAARHKRIVHVGFQSRSSASAASALEFIRSGNLGQIVLIKTYNMTGGEKWTAVPDSKVPDGLDWDLWLGPSPERQFNSGINDMENRGGWNNYWAFSGGDLSGKACHALDLARMIAGDPGHPLSVYCCGGNRVWNSAREVPEIQDITFDYGKFTITCESAVAVKYMQSLSANQSKAGRTFPDWLRISDRIEVYGTKGLMYIGLNGGGWQVIGPSDKIIAQETDTPSDTLHLKNFMTSLRTGNKSMIPVEQGHYSSSLVHLANISYRSGNKKLLFDGEKEEFINSEDANKLLKTAYRKGFVIPERV